GRRKKRSFHAAVKPATRVAGGRHELENGERENGDQHRHDRGQAEKGLSSRRHWKYCRYQLTSGSPATAATMAPMARNVPNGNADFSDPFLASRITTLKIEPATEESTSVRMTSFQPRKAPIMPSIFTSPMPRPSSCRTL